MSRDGEDDQPWLLSRRAFLGLGLAAAAANQMGTARAADPPLGRADPPLGRAATVSAAGAASLSAAKRRAIVSVAIHPGVGIARVGNSPDAFFLGPDVPGAVPSSQTAFRDPSGALARQAARFRIYGYDAAGDVVGEVTSADAHIGWNVHLANRKAAWYSFLKALDIPEAVPVARRNPTRTGPARKALVVDAGSHTARLGSAVRMQAHAMGIDLLLGELLTDAKGRLLVLAGHGVARAWSGAPLTTFANNDGWLDDLADGPVTASVDLAGRTLHAQSAWVVSAPPNFAPGLATGWRTLHDVLEDTWVAAGLMPTDAGVSFQRHILPLFLRLSRLQWVNAGIFRDYGWQSPRDLADPVFLARLADASAANSAFRQIWANHFRYIDTGTLERQRLPPILGDAVTFPASSPRQWIGLTPLQLFRLDEWVAGRFASDGIAAPTVSNRLEDLPLAQRPAALDRAALEACLGDAFHPGCEVTWPIRHASMWDAPYRLKVRAHPEPDYGPTLTPSRAGAADGPLTGSFPGSLTRWLAVPWMTDTVNCRSGYQPSVDQYLDTFWPARVPNQVLGAADYATVMDTTLPMARRQAAFERRKSWLRLMISSDYRTTLSSMVSHWPALGLIVAAPGPSDGAFPADFMVESGRTLVEPLAGAIEPAPMLEPPGLDSEPGTEGPQPSPQPSPEPGTTPEPSATPAPGATPAPSALPPPGTSASATLSEAAGGA